jgi:hypothetical protein
MRLAARIGHSHAAPRQRHAAGSTYGTYGRSPATAHARRREGPPAPPGGAQGELLSLFVLLEEEFQPGLAMEITLLDRASASCEPFRNAEREYSIRNVHEA